MQYSILIVLFLALPLVLGFMFRVSASHLFFSVMAGELLARYFGHEAESALHTFTNNDAFSAYGETVILILPLLLTALVMRDTISSNKTFLHVIPYLITGLVLVVFLLPVLPSAIQEGIKASQYGSELFAINSAIIGTVILLQLVALWLFGRNSEGGHRKHKKKHK